ncbi:MAG: MFS transporter, partial [Dysgonamonadaceae bacterium]|jgi:ACS family hexuronate transporter-like MFS transporter|nr:MFS transporter [Dysgonamonadaceae bacterium]
LAAATGDAAVLIATFSMWSFLVARCILALGEAGNFPAAIKATAEYFPKKDRAYATSIFNSGASIGALFAPLSIPPLATYFGWEMAFIIIGVLGFIWMGFWVFLYDKPDKCKHVSRAELEYIEQDKYETSTNISSKEKEVKVPFLKCFTYKQTWAFATGKFMTDGVWWFFLFWTPSYLSTQFGIKTSEGLGMALIFTLYAIVTSLSILGGKLPTIFINRSGQNPYAARMKAMLIFAFFPLCVLLAQPLGMEFAEMGKNAAWIPVLLISIGCAAHQAWSANLFSTIGDMFPKGAIATITGIGGMAGGIGSMILQKSAGNLFVYASGTAMIDGKEVEMTQQLLEQGAQFVRPAMEFMSFNGKPAGYFVIFCICAIAYLIGWTIMKLLVPKYKPINI